MHLLSKKNIILLFFCLCFNSTGMLALDSNFKKLSVDFPYDTRSLVKKENKLSYDLNSEILNSGKIQLYSKAMKESTFYNQYSNLVKLCEKYTEKLLKSAYNRIILSKYTYLINGMEEETLGVDLLKVDPNFRKLAFKQSDFYIPKNKKSKYHWISTQKIPGYFDNIRVGGKSFFYLKEDFSVSELDFFKKLNNISNDNLKSVTITELIDPKTPISDSAYKMTKRSHPYFKGSLSISFYYKLSTGRDEYLVMTYQVAGMKKPRYVGEFLLRKGLDLFQGGVPETIMGLRKYYEINTINFK